MAKTEAVLSYYLLPHSVIGTITQMEDHTLYARPPEQNLYLLLLSAGADSSVAIDFRTIVIAWGLPKRWWWLPHYFHHPQGLMEIVQMSALWLCRLMETWAALDFDKNYIKSVLLLHNVTLKLLPTNKSGVYGRVSLVFISGNWYFSLFFYFSVTCKSYRGKYCPLHKALVKIIMVYSSKNA